MSLQEVSSLPPNKILDERGEGNRGGGYRSARRLSQLTQRAVDKALKLQAESGRFVDVVDTQSCGDPGEFRCLMKYPFSPSASKLLKNPKFLFPSSSSRSWDLPKESQDRRTIAAKIYSFLIEWRSDVSFEWRSRVVLAVPVLEEALYRVAKCKEDYASQHLLEHVLLHFEAGNGLFLLQGTKPLYPVQASHAASLMGQDTLEQINCITVDSCKITPYDALPLENANVLPANDLGSGLDSESYFTDNSALWDALELGHPTSMEVGLHKCRDNPGKRITKRVVSMLSKRSDNHTLSRHELTNATHSEENIPSAGVRVDGAKTEMRNDGEFCEPSRIKQESPCYGDTRTRKSSRKTLGDMININLSNLPAIGSSFSSNVDEARPLPFKNEESNCLPTCSKHLHSFCRLKVDTMSTEAMRPFPSSSNMAKYSSIELMGPSSDKAKQSTGPSSLQELPVAPISLPNHTEALQLSPSPPKPKASPAPFSSSSSSSSSLSSALSGVSLSSVSCVSSSISCVPSSISSSISCVPSSSSPALVSSSSLSSVSGVSSSISCVPSSSSPALVSSSLPMSQVSSSSHVLSSSTSISHVSPSSLSLPDVSSLSSSHTAQISISSPLKLAPSSPPTESLTQPLHHMPPSSVFIEGEQNQELEEQMPTTAATSQDIETEAASRSLLSTTITATANRSLLSTTASSQEIETDAASRSLLSTTITATASNDSSLEARERGPRLPLSIFLSERDEFDVDSLAETSGDNARSWNTWEEPTEQIDPLCCVCMIGLKGAAFIPCGHTFCRKCSRELWRGRGACPLCNRYIREILDVY